MYERLLITFVVMAFFAAVLALLKRRQMTLAGRASEQLKKSSGTPTIVYFWANGCPVCKMTQKQILEGILAEYGREQLTLTAYNTDEAPDVARKWGVRTLPTTFLLDSTGTVRQVNNGLATAETLRRQLASVLKTNASVGRR